jgi:DNA polymerase III delta prime subunit
LILNLAGGDLRKAITYLQTAQRLHAAAVPPEPISAISSKLTGAEIRLKQGKKLIRQYMKYQASYLPK